MCRNDFVDSCKHATSRTIAPDATTQLNAECSSSLPSPPPPPPSYCSHRMKNNQSLESIQVFAGRGGEKLDVYFPPFFSISLCLPVSPLSSKSKIINHLPADKISCSMGEQLQHLVGSCDEVRSNFLPLSPRFPRAHPERCQHPANRRTRAAETIRRKKTKNRRLIFSRGPVFAFESFGGS